MEQNIFKKNEEGSCIYCENNSICKWNNTLDRCRKEVGELISSEKDCPIRIKVSCIKFRNKTQVLNNNANKRF